MKKFISMLLTIAMLLSVVPVATATAQVDYITIKGVEYSTSLVRLSLDGRELTDDDIKPLEYMTNLTELILSENQITDLSPLSGLTNLSILYLGANQISDLTPLSGLPNLTTLALFNNQISDISPLSELTTLTSLGLNINQVSDLTTLAELTNLIVLYLDDNPITLEQVNELQDALPDCYISHNAGAPAKADFEITTQDKKIGTVDIFAGSILIEVEESGTLTIPASELDGILTDNMYLFAVVGNRTVIETGKPVENQDGSITVMILAPGTYFLQRIQPGSVRGKGKVTGNASDITISDALHTLMAVAKMPSSDAYGDNADARSVRAAKVNDPDASEIGISDALQVLMFVARMPSSKVTLLNV